VALVVEVWRLANREELTAAWVAYTRACNENAKAKGEADRLHDQAVRAYGASLESLRAMNDARRKLERLITTTPAPAVRAVSA
jgi:hypothetical protein